MSALPRLPCCIPKSPFAAYRRLHSEASRLSKFVKVSKEVQDALSSSTPVVALETAIYTHGKRPTMPLANIQTNVFTGLPFPENVELAAKVEEAVRDNGATPATIGILNGVACIGMIEEELRLLASSSGQATTVKVSRRDLPFVTGMRRGDLYSGGTTISGTMILAHMAGIKVFATGGLGGVHRGYPGPMDVSADLIELGKTNVAVISSGSKAFLDLENTFEVLETHGVFVGTFGEPGAEVKIPAFYSRESNILSPNVLETPGDAANIIYASHSMGLGSGQLMCNPIPPEAEIPAKDIKGAIFKAVEKARKNGVFGKDNTPYILKEIKQSTDGGSVLANIALVLNNAKMGARVAKELSKLEGDPPASRFMPHPLFQPLGQSSVPLPTQAEDQTDLLVIGSVAIDLSCDTVAPEPTMHTSNPSRNIETLGGVGKNVALAAQLAGAKVRLVSAVGSDLAGKWAIRQMEKNGMDTSGVEIRKEGSTSRYVAVNCGGELLVACADMDVVEKIDHEWIKTQMERGHAKCICVDGNLSPTTLQEIMCDAKELGVNVVFEPTSTAKSTRILSPSLGVFPNSSLSISTPNNLELGAMFSYARESGLFEGKDWWKTIDNTNIDSTFLRRPWPLSSFPSELANKRIEITKLSHNTSLSLLSTGLVQSAIHLSPYIPTQLIKLGPSGVLLVQLLPPDTTSPPLLGAVVSKGFDSVRGIAIKHFPAEVVGKRDIANVNGAGDTFLGAFLAGLSSGRGLDEIIAKAQKAAAMTLGSKESVNPLIGQ